MGTDLPYVNKSSRKSAKVFHEKDATLIAEKVCVLKKPVGGWWKERVDLSPCNCEAFWSNFPKV
jgi:hypothetical protein